MHHAARVCLIQSAAEVDGVLENLFDCKRTPGKAVGQECPLDRLPGKKIWILVA
jgi:hypothetical protein